MNEELETFLQQHTPIAEEIAIWDDTTHLRITSYLSDTLPPLDYVTSVRATVLLDENVLVVREQVRLHIQPGGRREHGETLQQTLQRELLEETGWRIEHIHLLGFKRLHHLTPIPADYPHLAPDFLQIIYTARAHTYKIGAMRLDDIEIEAFFHPLDKVQELNLTSAEMLYLEVARKLRK